MERVVERENMGKAYARVMRNKGGPGIDKMTVTDLKAHLQTNWPAIKEQLVTGSYRPKPVKRVEIPKAGGGVRVLGVPTVVDRLIQQAIHQVLSPIYEPTFSDSSYGFRPGKSAHQALKQAKRYQQEGKRWVVDMDLTKFFDEVNHDKLLSKLSHRIKDQRLLRLIRFYLRAGMMAQGLVTVRDKGTPQGGPLSPLLSNIVLDDLDKELERRGHAFCRYADDSQVYVKTERAAQRVLVSLTRYVEGRLRLKVNEKKSAVAKSCHRVYLGYSFMADRDAKLRVPKETLEHLKVKLKVLFRQGRGRNLAQFILEDLNPVIKGWINYFALAEVKRFAEEVDGWIRRRLRLILWRQWKRPWTRRKKLMAAGLKEERAVMSAFNRHGPWWNSGASHMNAAIRKTYFDHLGLVSTVDELFKLRVFHSENRLGT